MQPTLDSKLPEVGVTIFTTMTRLAIEHGAINLSQGFPDFDPHPELIERVAYHMRRGMNQYAPMQGMPVVRERIAAKVKALYGADIDPHNEITLTAGGTEALYAAITAVVRPGDEVIVLEPAFDVYGPAIRLNGGIPVFVPMVFPGYGIDWDRLAASLTPRTRLLILNSPHNPTGTALGPADIEQLRRIAEEHAFFILSDEVYEHIIFDGIRHESMLRYPDLAGRSFVVSSFGKTYHATGWKIGYCIAPRPMSAEFQKIHQYLVFTANTPIQLGLGDFLPRSELFLELGAFYQRKRDSFLAMTASSRFKPLPCSGTYFLMMDYSSVSDEPDQVFARRLTVEHGVAAIPPSVFHHDGRDHKVLRFCFAKKDETLAQAAERLCRI